MQKDERMRRALAPSMEEIRRLPASSNAKSAAELLGGSKGNALDIGCGEGKFTRLLARLLGRASGIDVKADKIAEAQEAARAETLDLEFRVASADALPYPNGAFAVVAFSNSLHHMPDPGAALAEAVRVLAPGGQLYVMEPVAAGNYFEATRLVNDETEVRTEAYRALGGLTGLAEIAETMYRATRSFVGFEQWRAEQFDMDAKRRARYEAQPEEIRRRFEANADRRDGQLGFEQVSRVNLFQKAR